MIQDKDFTLRLIRQLTQALEKLILDKPEESLMQKELDYDSLMKDIFKISFVDLSNQTQDEFFEMVELRESKYDKDYYELLGYFFYLRGKELKNEDFLNKSKTFYEFYLQKSGIFALPIITRIDELKNLIS